MSIPLDDAMSEFEGLLTLLRQLRALQQLQAEMKHRFGEASEQYKALTPLIEQLRTVVAGQLTANVVDEVMAKIDAAQLPQHLEDEEPSLALSPVPIVRYMLLCEDCLKDPKNPRRLSMIGLLSHLNAVGDPPYPAFCEELCVFLALTEGRGQGMAKIICTFEESGERIFETTEYLIQFGPDPLEVTAKLFRIRAIQFPRPGRYLIQFCYEGRPVEERPLLLR